VIGAFTGVLALGLILVPGFSYRIGRESGRESGLAAKRPLGFRETALLIVPGFLATFAGLCVFAFIRAVRPSNTPDIGGDRRRSRPVHERPPGLRVLVVCRGSGNS